MKKFKKISFSAVTLVLALGFSSLTAFSQEVPKREVPKTEALKTEEPKSEATESKPEAKATDQGATAADPTRFDQGWYGVLSANSNKTITATLDGGYQFNKVLALEGTYGFLSTDVQESIPTIAVRAVGSYRINDDFTVLGRAGVALLKRTAKCLAVFNTCYSNFNGAAFEKDYVKPTFGLAFQYEAFEDFAIRASYDTYKFGEDSTAVNEFGLGIVKRF